jgi:hypothetical protein
MQFVWRQFTAKCEKKRGRVESAQTRNLLCRLYLHLTASDFKDLERLADVVKLNGFLRSFEGGHGKLTVSAVLNLPKEKRPTRKLRMTSDASKLINPDNRVRPLLLLEDHGLTLRWKVPTTADAAGIDASSIPKTSSLGNRQFS